MIVADLAAWLEAFAPSRLAEPWDNVGLLLGDPMAPIRNVEPLEYEVVHFQTRSYK